MSDTPFRFSSFNILGTRFSNVQSWYKRRSLVHARMSAVLGGTKPARASIYALQEAGEDESGWLKSQMAGYKRWYRGAQCLLFDTRKWEHQDECEEINLFTGYHGGIMAPLTHRETGRDIIAASVHMPPWSKIGTGQRDAVFAEVLDSIQEYAEGHDVILGIDANTSIFVQDARKVGFVAARDEARSRTGNHHRTHDPFTIGPAIDHILGRGVTFRGYYNINSGTATDHQLLTAQVTA